MYSVWPSFSFVQKRDLAKLGRSFNNGFYDLNKLNLFVINTKQFVVRSKQNEWKIQIVQKWFNTLALNKICNKFSSALDGITHVIIQSFIKQPISRSVLFCLHSVLLLMSVCLFSISLILNFHFDNTFIATISFVLINFLNSYLCHIHTDTVQNCIKRTKN